MKTLSLRLALLSVVVLIALGAVPAMALESSRVMSPAVRPLAPAEAGGTDVMPMVVWSIVAIAGFGTLFGTLYLLKRRVGGFPANPTWVAPITVMPSRDFADEGTFGAPPDDSHH